MAKLKVVVALIVGISPSVGGCSFIRDLAIDAFLPEARPLIDSLRKQAEPAVEPEPEPVVVAPPPPPTPLATPTVIAPLPQPIPPPKPKSILSPDDEAERRAIEAYEQRLEEIRQAIQRRVTKP